MRQERMPTTQPDIKYWLCICTKSFLQCLLCFLDSSLGLPKTGHLSYWAQCSHVTQASAFADYPGCWNVWDAKIKTLLSSEGIKRYRRVFTEISPKEEFPPKEEKHTETVCFNTLFWSPFWTGWAFSSLLTQTSLWLYDSMTLLPKLEQALKCHTQNSTACLSFESRSLILYKII